MYDVKANHGRILDSPEQDPRRHKWAPGRARAPHASASCHPRDYREKSSIHHEESYLLDVESGGGTGEKGSNGELHFDCIILLGYDLKVTTNVEGRRVGFR